MALQGNLKDLKLGDVLQTILAAGSKGLLRVRGSSRRAVLYLGADGLSIVEPSVLDEKLVIDSYIRRGKLAATVAERARGPQGVSLDGLVAMGELEKRDVDRILREAAEEAVLDVLGLDDGSFRFDEGAEPDHARSAVARVLLDPQGLLLRAAQRIDELKALQERIGTNAALLIAVDATSAVADSMESPAPEVHRCLDGRTLLEEIAVGEGLNRFAVAKCAAALVDAGAVRLPTPEELRALAAQREAADDVGSALALARQWQTVRPLEPEPCVETAAIAARAGRYDDEAEALKAAGRVNLKIQRGEDARALFDRLLVKRPGDPDAIEGLRQAAKLLGDAAGFSSTTRTLAEMALEAGDAVQASTILKELISAYPEDVAARLLRTKALARLGDRVQAAEELERLADLLPTPCRRKADRDAAEYVRDTLPHLLPEHHELLDRFRAKLGNRAKSRKRVAIVGAFLVACSGVAFVFWPVNAATIWARAQAAAAAGESPTALALIDDLMERHPDSPEFGEALTLKAKLDGSLTAAAARKAQATAAEKFAAQATQTAKMLPALPSEESIASIDALSALLRTAEGSTPKMRLTATEILRAPMAEVVEALRRPALERRDTLDSAADIASKPPADIDVFRTVTEKLEQALEPAWCREASRTTEILRRFVVLLREDSLLPGTLEDLHALDANVKAAERAIVGRAKDVHRVRVEYQRALISAAYERSRIDAAKALAQGELDAAETIYANLDRLVGEVGSEPVYEPLREWVARRGVADLARTRLEFVASIRRGIAAAKAAEDAGNLEGAAGDLRLARRAVPLRPVRRGLLDPAPRGDDAAGRDRPRQPRRAGPVTDRGPLRLREPDGRHRQGRRLRSRLHRPQDHRVQAGGAGARLAVPRRALGAPAAGCRRGRAARRRRRRHRSAAARGASSASRARPATSSGRPS